MASRLRNRIQFLLERWIQRGALYQLLFMLVLIVTVAFVGGLLAASTTSLFASLGDAVWWAFLRLTDPGYLGDDEGTALRSISTVITVLGYVLFMGSLIAIMTQWLNQEIRRLESGLTPIAIQNHFLVLGWTNRTPSILRELVLSEERVRRFLQKRGARGLRIVVLAEEVSSSLRQEIREIVGRKRHGAHVILRSGSSMRIEHLRRVDYARASAIIIPGADFALGGPEATDTRIVKTLMSISNGDDVDPGRQPSVVAEIYDAQKIPIVEQAYGGHVHIVAGDAFSSRLIVQTVRHRGLSFVYSELLSHEHGNQIYVRQVEAFSGRDFWSLPRQFPGSVLLGVARPVGKGFRSILNPPNDFVLEEEDRIIMIAKSYGASFPEVRTIPLSVSESADPPPRMTPLAPIETQALRRIIVLGWSHKVATLIQELSEYPNERFEVVVFSLVPIRERQEALRHVTDSSDRVVVTHAEGDYVRQSDLARIDWSLYDNCVFLGSDWLDSSEETDARSILGYSAVRAALANEVKRPEILVELIDPSNAFLFKRRPGEVIISPVVLSHMLAHAALRPELTSVFAELFGPHGSEIFFRPIADYPLRGARSTFRDIQRVAQACGEIAIGVRIGAPKDEARGGVDLNPPPDEPLGLGDTDEVVVLTRPGCR